MLRRLLDWFRDFEPAQLNAIKTSALGLLAVLGVTLSTDVEGHIGAIVAAAVVVLTEVQALMTRFGVFAPATVQRIRQGQE